MLPKFHPRQFLGHDRCPVPAIPSQLLGEPWDDTIPGLLHMTAQEPRAPDNQLRMELEKLVPVDFAGRRWTIRFGG